MPSQPNERVLVAFVVDLMALDALLLLADIAPDFVQLDAAGTDANHHPVMQFGTTASDAGAKAHNGVAVNAGKAFNCADALAFGQAGND